MVDENLLIYSQTFSSLVMPHCLHQNQQDSEPSLSSRAQTIHRFLSAPELRSLASLIGSDGVNHLIDEHIIRDGVLKELRALKNALPHHEDEEKVSVSVLTVLVHGIKAGCYLAVREMLLSALAQENEDRMPRLARAAKRMEGDGEAGQTDVVARFMGEFADPT